MVLSYTGELRSASVLMFRFGSEEESPERPCLLCLGLRWRMALE